MASRSANMGILMFDDVEVLDFAGPFEVFSVASRVALRDGLAPVAPFRVLTVAATGTAPTPSGVPVLTRHGLQVSAMHSLADCPPLDVLILPGGVIDDVAGRPEVIDWVRTRHAEVLLTASVCTGAFILGRAGLLDGLTATTHWEDAADLAHAQPTTRVAGNIPYVDQGRILTSGGIAAGIAMSLHLVAALMGDDLARLTARQMEYPFTPDQGLDEAGKAAEIRRDQFQALVLGA